MSAYDVDVLVIGGGVNGLVAAGLLARAGVSVRLFEQAGGFGGLASLGSDGGLAPLGAIDLGRFRPDLADRLELDRHGWSTTGAAADTLVGWSSPAQGPDDGAVELRLFCDAERAVDVVARRSRDDAEALPRFLAHVESLLPRFETVLRGPASVEAAAGLARDAELMRFVSASLDDLLGWWFRSEAVKVAFAGLALHASGLAPRDQGTGWLLLDQLFGTTARALRAPRGQEPGEDGRFVDALSASARSAGARLQSGYGVRRLVVGNGKLRSVVFEDGEQVRPRLVISTLDAPATLLRLVGGRHLPVEVARALKRQRVHGTTARWTSAEGERDASPPAVVVAESLDAMQRAADDAKRGIASRRPWAVRWGGCVDLHYLPYPLSAPDTSPWSSLGTGHLVTPAEREKTTGATGGGEQGALMSLDQLLVGRGCAGTVGCATPIEGLLLGGAAAHPGGGVTGLPGVAAAETALRRLGGSPAPAS